MTEEPNLLCYPAPERNKQPIVEVLAQYLPSQGTVLEVASGTGQHIVHFAQRLSNLSWLPSEVDDELLQVIEARLAHHNLPNVGEPTSLDVLGAWPALEVDGLITANIFHIAPVEVVAGFFAGADSVLSAQGIVHIYGPFSVDGQHTSEGNQAFDADLRRRNPSWGIRDLADVVGKANEHGFSLTESIPMPANNLSLVFAR